MELKPEMFKRFFPLPVTLITTVDEKGIVNAAPYSSVMPILRPLDLIAIASAIPRDTLKNIRETKEFVVNVIGKPSLKMAMKCARNYPPELNELEEVGLESIPSKKVSPPRVKDAVGWVEAKLEREITERNFSLVIGKVVFAETNDSYLDRERLIEPPVVTLFPEFRSLGDKIANSEELLEDMSFMKFQGGIKDEV